ncbi:MAG: HipA domain-containing protein [Gemmatimonadales bacterium]
MSAARGAEVYVALGDRTVRVGRLVAVSSSRGERAGFEYDPLWLAAPERYALEPALMLGAGPYYPPADRALFGAFGDSAPDRWGRTLLLRAERRRAARDGGSARALHELDFLLGVLDEARPGALRFTALGGGPWLAEGPAIPPLVALRRLVAAADRVETGDDTEEDLALLLAPGSSLGGARPKASVREPDGALALAKFPRPGDLWSVVVWEAVALELARRAGVTVAPSRLVSVGGRRVLVVARFDRRGAHRVPFLSAMTLLGARDHDPAAPSYPDLADALRRHGAQATDDVRQLWRRMVFNVLIANTDDHLRNHGVLYAGQDGWVLSPAYDLNPVPADVGPRELTTPLTYDGDRTADVEIAFTSLEAFALTRDAASTIVAEVRRAVAGWRAVARGLGCSAAECDRMASAFEERRA